MTPLKSFPVFGDPVDVLHSSVQTHGVYSVVVQSCQPGGGPPPHWHDKEDEFFTVLEGEFELLADGVWSKVGVGETAFTVRGNVHTFRNSGTTLGRILCLASPGGLDEYLEAISPIVMPKDAPLLFEISDRFGIHFLPPPETAA